MKDLINHFNKKKQDFNHFFMSIIKIVEQVNYTTQLQIDKEYDEVMNQFCNAPQESIQSACQQMQKNRSKIFKSLIDALYEQLKIHIQVVNKQITKTNQIQSKVDNEDSFKQDKQNQNTIFNNLNNKSANSADINVNRTFINNSANINNRSIEDRLQKKEISLHQRVSKSPPKIIFKTNPINSYQFNYNNQSIFQSNVQQFKQMPFVQQRNVTNYNYQNQKQIQPQYYSGKVNNIQKTSHLNMLNSWSIKDQKDQKQKIKRKISVTKNHQICENLDRHILNEASQLLLKSQSRKRFSSLKRSNASYKKSPQKQGKFINLVNGTVNMDKILQSRIGEHQLNNSKKIIVGSEEYTSPVKKYNL